MFASGPQGSSAYLTQELLKSRSGTLVFSSRRCVQLRMYLLFFLVNFFYTGFAANTIEIVLYFTYFIRVYIIY